MVEKAAVIEMHSAQRSGIPQLSAASNKSATSKAQIHWFVPRATSSAQVIEELPGSLEWPSTQDTNTYAGSEASGSKGPYKLYWLPFLPCRVTMALGIARDP